MNLQFANFKKSTLNLLGTAVLTLIPITANATCPTGQEQYDRLDFIGKDDTVVSVDHRGDMSGKVPENSLLAFQGSYKKCRHAIETDVRLSKDGALMVFHDANIGRVLETGYNPETNSGPNPPISSLTQQEIQSKQMHSVNWDVTSQYVPTVNEVISDYIANNGQSLFYFDIKDEKAIIMVAKAISEEAKTHPDVLKRFIVKFGMEHVPTYEKWQELLIKEGANSAVMANPYISPWGAEKINKMDIPNPPGEQYEDNTSRAVASWARQPAKLVPNVEVVIKNSDDFITTTKRLSDQGIYEKPTSLESDNTFKGSMARMISIIKSKQKALGLFVPNPDFIQWKKDKVTQGVTIKSTTDGRQLNIESAYILNTGNCCYTMEERLGPNEQEDIRMNLAWARSIGANVITVDDPDSVDTYYRMQDELDKVAIPVTVKPSKEMNSVLSRQLNLLDNFPKENSIFIKPWLGEAAWGWGGVVCLWDNFDGDHYAWTYRCDYANATADGYHKIFHTKVIEKHKYSSEAGAAIQIFNENSEYCLTIDRDAQRRLLWEKNCNTVEDKSLFIFDRNHLIPVRYYHSETGRKMVRNVNQGMYGLDMYGSLTVDNYVEDDTWGLWGIYNSSN